MCCQQPRPTQLGNCQEAHCAITFEKIFCIQDATIERLYYFVVGIFYGKGSGFAPAAGIAMLVTTVVTGVSAEGTISGKPCG